jgi:enamine deaminase RidA (YjgF/YER057c/UK114 family)
VERRLIPGHSPYERIVGFSRALVSGRTVHVAGTAPIPREGDPPEGAYDQMRLCLELVGEALEQAGASFADVVRTRMFIVDPADWQEIARAHGEVFSEIRPASTAIVTGLLDPRWRVEIEAEAVLPA